MTDTTAVASTDAPVQAEQASRRGFNLRGKTRNLPKGPGIACPSCGGPSSVANTRQGEAKATIRRSRTCNYCRTSFVTHERIAEGPYHGSTSERTVRRLGRKYRDLNQKQRTVVKLLIETLWRGQTLKARRANAEELLP